MTFTIPNIFIAGKKAVALEVNENFNVIKNELNRQSESLTKASELAQKTEDYVSNNLKGELESLIKTVKAYFCVNAGNINSKGAADLLVIDGISPMRVTFRVGDGLEGNFASVVYSNYKGEQTTRVSLSPVDMTGKANGVYNIFGKITGSPYALNNKVYRCTSRPDLNANDVWLNTSCLPVRAIQYNGVSDYEFNDVPLGTATIEDGALKSVHTFPYNQNGFDVNAASMEWRKVLPDYSRAVSKSVNTAILAEQDGFIVATSANFQNSEITIKVGFDETCPIVLARGANSNNYAQNVFTLNGWVTKDMYYMTSGPATSLVFYPCIGN